MSFITGFFKDADGSSSMGRLCCFICVVSGCAVACIRNEIIVSSMLIGLGLGSKLIQNKQEK